MSVVFRQAASFRGGDSSRTQPQSRPDISNRKGPVELVSVTSADEWEKMCGETFKGICAIAFMGAPEGVDPADAANLEQMQKAMDAMDLTSAYNFVWVDASCQTKLAELFDVSGGSTPALAVYSPLKNRFAKYIGSFSKVRARELVHVKESSAPNSIRRRTPFAPTWTTWRQAESAHLTSLLDLCTIQRWSVYPQKRWSRILRETISVSHGSDLLACSGSHQILLHYYF